MSDYSVFDNDIELRTLKAAAKAAVDTPGFQISTAYVFAREIWSLWWKRHDYLVAQMEEKYAQDMKNIMRRYCGKF